MQNESLFCQIRVFTQIHDGALKVRLELMTEPLTDSLLQENPKDHAAIWEMLANTIRDYHGLPHSSGVDTPFIALQKQVKELRDEIERMKGSISE